MGTLEAIPGSFVDSDLRDRHADLLFQVSLSGRSALIHVLYEHQSAPHGLPPRILDLSYRTSARLAGSGGGIFLVSADTSPTSAQKQ